MIHDEKAPMVATANVLGELRNFIHREAPSRTLYRSGPEAIDYPRRNVVVRSTDASDLLRAADALDDRSAWGIDAREEVVLIRPQTYLERALLATLTGLGQLLLVGDPHRLGSCGSAPSDASHLLPGRGFERELTMLAGLSGPTGARTRHTASAEPRSTTPTAGTTRRRYLLGSAPSASADAA